MGGRRETERRRRVPDNRPGYKYGYRQSRRGYYVTRRRRWSVLGLALVVLLLAALRGWRG